MPKDLDRVIAAAEAGELPALIDEWSQLGQLDDPRRWLALALRIDLPVLVTRPDLAVPCMYRRCVWLGSSAEGVFYKTRSPLPVDAFVLRAIVGAWTAEWLGQKRKRWLRPLRPPDVPLDGGVIEEYRTTAPGDLRFSADATHVGIAGAVAWERKSGRRSTSTSMLDLGERPTKSPRWKIGAGRSAGSMVLEENENEDNAKRRRWAIAHNELDTAWGIHELNDERFAIVSCSGDDPYACGDDEPAYYLVDLQAGRIVWRSLGSCASGIVVRSRSSEERVFVREYGAVVLYVLATGQRIAEWTMPIEQLAVTVDGSVFATRSNSGDGGTIRVWDPARIPKPQTELASYGLLGFSPDGQRLATGNFICDARTGDVLAKVDFHGYGSWLEGGPPAHCRRLCNGVLIEQTPFGLYAWDTSTGRLVVEDRERSAEVGDAVCFDPTGRHHARWIGRSHREKELRPLRVFALLDGRVLFEREIELARAPEKVMTYRLGFSSSGDQLWWETADGKCFLLTIANGDVREVAASEISSIEDPEPRQATITDGLLIVGDDLAIPIDAATAIASSTGTSFASGNAHYVIEG